MLSLFGSLLGFGTSFLPSILSFLEQGQKNRHQLKLLDAQAKHAEVLSKLKVEELDAQADVSEAENIYKHATELAKANKSSFVSALQASVRPVITYFFFVVFGLIKISCLCSHTKVTMLIAILNSWDEESKILFSTIISLVWARNYEINRKAMK